MNDTNKCEYYYRLWEFHANLLWNKVQYLVVILVGIYTGWFILFQFFMGDNKFDYLYFILAMLISVFGTLICYNFLKLAKRDIQHQKYFEERLSNLFGELKCDKVNKKIRGRYIFQRLIKICAGSCIILFVFTIMCFCIKQSACLNCIVNGR